VAAELSVANTDAWKAGLRRAIATHLGISAWRVLIDYVRAGSRRGRALNVGSVQVGMRIIDADGAGTEESAAQSAAYLKELLVGKDQLEVAEYSLTAAEVMESPPPPPSSPSPSPPPPAETCDCNDADASDECKLTCETLGAAVGIAGSALIVAIVLPIVGCLLLGLIIALVVYCCCCKDKKAAVGAPAQPTAADS
jgi:hypothetical protein